MHTFLPRVISSYDENEGDVFALEIFRHQISGQPTVRAGDSARQLARILAEKGGLTREELAGLERNGPTDAVLPLADLLRIRQHANMAIVYIL